MSKILLTRRQPDFILLIKKSVQEILKVGVVIIQRVPVIDLPLNNCCLSSHLRNAVTIHVPCQTLLGNSGARTSCACSSLEKGTCFYVLCFSTVNHFFSFSCIPCFSLGSHLSLFLLSLADEIESLSRVGMSLNHNKMSIFILCGRQVLKG